MTALAPKTVLSLDGAWTVSARSGEAPADLLERSIPATVPGCVHLDLLAAGLIGEPFDGDNEAAQQWIGSTEWVYRRTFSWQGNGHERHALVAAGLDTIATLTLNGAHVASTENQNRSYRWAIGHLLHDGENELVITFAAPIPAIERREAENGGHLFHVNHHPYNALRKTASNLGWDWGIDVATSGIWQPISIESWSGVRLAQVRPLVDVAGTAGILSAHVDLQEHGIPQLRSVRVSVVKDGVEVGVSTASIRTSGSVTVSVPEVELWWPRGHGEQPLYDVTVEVGADSWTHQVGFRTVALNSQPDADGTPFELQVNGRTIMIRGANWIPDDAFVTRIDTARLERRIADATQAGMNLLRIWGGGMYESEEFYSICTREGLLVWQDFLLACAAYAEEAWLADEIEAEAREAVARLSKHASLVLWCGNNENLVGYAEWGWRGELEGRTWGEYYYTQLFPSIIGELDPTRPYIPGSPFSASSFLSPNIDKEGTVHIWDVWNEKDYRAYAEWKPRFVAEFGFQGPAAYTTLFDVVHDVPLDPNGHELLVHQKANNGNLKLERGLDGHFPQPRTIDDWHFVTQLNQAHAMRFGISFFRSLAPYNTGTVIWQLNDDWPVVSWAAVDYAERRKPLWYALREVYRARFATIQPADDGLDLVVLNDSDEPFDGVATLSRFAFSGSTLATAELTVSAPARGQARVRIPPAVAEATDSAGEVLVATFGVPSSGGPFVRAIHNFAEVVEQSLEVDPVEASVELTPTGAVVTVVASSYVRDLTVLADRADPSARVDSSLVSLLAGESATFVLTADAPLEPGAVLDAKVLRHANQLLGEPVGELLA